MQNFLILANMFIFVSACITLTFISFWLRNFQETKSFLGVGVTFVLILFLADATAIYVVGIDSIGQATQLILFLFFVNAVRNYAFTVGGLLLARRLNDAHSLATPADCRDDPQTSYGVFVPSRHAMFWALLAVVFMLLLSTIFFQLSDAKIRVAFQEGFELSRGVGPVDLLVVAAVGFSEEITFRLGLQTGLTYVWRSAKYGHHWAVLATAAFWSLGHIGSIDPDWVKIVQILVFGLILGQMNRRFGVIPCIITHSLFNIIIAIFAPQILGVGVTHL